MPEIRWKIINREAILNFLLTQNWICQLEERQILGIKDSEQSMR